MDRNNPNQNPRQDTSQIPPDRLMDAVDAIFAAVHEVAMQHGKEALTGLPSEWMGTDLQPKALCEYTMHEVIEAEMFLRRCGFIQDEATL